MKHSTIVGGSTASRVMACPGSVALCAKMPPKPSSTYADRGTLLHSAMTTILETEGDFSVIGTTYEGEVLTQELYEEKIIPAMEAVNTIDPDAKMEYATEADVQFGKWLPGVFGSCDLIGRIGPRAILIDWKFGDGVAVSAEENKQLMFYAAAAMRTPDYAWVFDGATELELIIVQPPEVKRWVTTPKRVRTFELALKRAVKESAKPEAKLQHGDHCRWCAAKPICPLMTGAVDRALVTQLAGLDKVMIGKYLANADLLEEWIKDLRALAMQTMEAGVPVPGWKLVAKRSVRKWVDENNAAAVLQDLGIDAEGVFKVAVVSPAQAEKLLKPLKKELPEGLADSVSSGNTFATEDDPRPAIVQIGQQLTKALEKLV